MGPGDEDFDRFYSDESNNPWEGRFPFDHIEIIPQNPQKPIDKLSAACYIGMEATNYLSMQGGVLGMLNKLPPHNQRRLNVKITETYGGKYQDWYELARSLQLEGYTYAQIAEEFSKLGVKVSLYTVREWMGSRRSS
jgi:hypothetical protein